MDRVDEYFKAVPPPTPDEITNAFWCACHGAQRAAAEYLLDRGADLKLGWYDKLSPLDAANRSSAYGTGGVVARPRRQVGERINRRVTS